ncbi:hypothetical protein [uncultured Duncaniella sp.]|uniref:hypothetical protein n=1 Tax=uncultured Duncaniella sp. TaxID=2768039 RepID=UPI0025A9DF50|nr:hypothetical protein [uncultured Duncaniella sp.]
MSEFENDGLTITQRVDTGREEGYEEGLRLEREKTMLKNAITMAKLMGKSFEESLRLLQAGDSDGETSTDGSSHTGRGEPESDDQAIALCAAERGHKLGREDSLIKCANAMADSSHRTPWDILQILKDGYDRGEYASGLKNNNSPLARRVAREVIFRDARILSKILGKSVEESFQILRFGGDGEAQEALKDMLPRDMALNGEDIDAYEQFSREEFGSYEAVPHFVWREIHRYVSAYESSVYRKAYNEAYASSPVKSFAKSYAQPFTDAYIASSVETRVKCVYIMSERCNVPVCDFLNYAMDVVYQGPDKIPSVFYEM